MWTGKVHCVGWTTKDDLMFLKALSEWSKQDSRISQTVMILYTVREEIDNLSFRMRERLCGELRVQELHNHRYRYACVVSNECNVILSCH